MDRQTDRQTDGIWMTIPCGPIGAEGNKTDFYLRSLEPEPVISIFEKKNEITVW